MKRKVNITVKQDLELCSKIIINEEPYIVETDFSKEDKTSIVVRVYKKGEIISSYREDLGNNKAIMPAGEFEGLVKNIHSKAIETLKKDKLKVTMGPSDYLDKAKVLLNRKKFKSALALIAEGVKAFSDNSLLLSYYGYLTVKYENNYDKGIADCKKAIEMISGTVPYDLEFVYPIFYMNLGRAYLAANDRKNAVEVFDRLLSLNAGNKEVLNELKKQKLIRRKPAIPFLKRSNPINKYLGILRHKLEKGQT